MRVDPVPDEPVYDGRRTGECDSYAKLIPEARHWIGKTWMREIEWQNLNFRTHLKRLHRRTI